MKAHGNDTVLPQKDGSFLLDCPIPKGWLGRKTGTQTSAEHPGTAVRWHGEIYEVLAASAMAEGGMEYRLAPWDPRHAIRVVETYDTATEAARGLEQTRRRESIRQRRLSILLAPLLGHLPGDVQGRMEMEVGAPARAMTISSVLPLLALGVAGFLSYMACAFAGGYNVSRVGTSVIPLPWFCDHPLLALYLVVESLIRLWSVVVTGEPMGSLPGVLVYEVWRLTGHGGSPTAPRPATAKWDPADTYKMLEPLLGLLSPEEQELLERRRGFDSLRWGRRSVILIGIVGALNVVISLGLLAQGRDEFWDFAWLLTGAYLCVEQVLRLRQIGQGHPAGSVLGALIRPLARSLLAPEQGQM